VAFLKKQKADSDVAPVGGFEQTYSSFLSYVGKMTHGSRVGAVVISLTVAAILIVLASLPFLNLSYWIYVLIGFPAGIIVFANLVALFHFTRIKDSSLFTYKDRVPPRRRMQTVAITAVGVVVVLILFGGTIPRGLGGTIVITLALLAYNLIRRTPEEVRLAQLGLPDPREIEKEEEE